MAAAGLCRSSVHVSLIPKLCAEDLGVSRGGRMQVCARMLRKTPRACGWSLRVGHLSYESMPFHNGERGDARGRQ